MSPQYSYDHTKVKASVQQVVSFHQCNSVPIGTHEFIRIIGAI